MSHVRPNKLVKCEGLSGPHRNSDLQVESLSVCLYKFLRGRGDKFLCSLLEKDGHMQNYQKRKQGERSERSERLTRFL